MSGVTLNMYIRRRRLTLAAYELRSSDIKIIDVAVKYGYNSADAFAKAFAKQHGITPTQARSLHQQLRVYPPISFHILIKGATEMNFRIMETAPSDCVVYQNNSSELLLTVLNRNILCGQTNMMIT